MEQTAVEYVIQNVIKKHFGGGWLIDETIKKEIEQSKEMEEQQSQAYATFCINCYREDYPILDFESYIKVKERHGQSNI